MYPLFESLCVQDGIILNIQWHKDRFQKAYLQNFGYLTSFDLLEGITHQPRLSEILEELEDMDVKTPSSDEKDEKDEKEEKNNELSVNII